MVVGRIGNLVVRIELEGWIASVSDSDDHEQQIRLLLFCFWQSCGLAEVNLSHKDDGIGILADLLPLVVEVPAAALLYDSAASTTGPRALRGQESELGVFEVTDDLLHNIAIEGEKPGFPRHLKTFGHQSEQSNDTNSSDGHSKRHLHQREARGIM